MSLSVAVVSSIRIVCQWITSLDRQLSTIKPSDSALSEGVRALFARAKILVVPKPYRFARVMHRFIRYDYSLAQDIGQTDGEGCTRIWAGVNPAAASMREMGPGSMQDTINDMCSSWNWQKTCDLAPLPSERLDDELQRAQVDISRPA
ncbi:unnamed protein product [Peniophora sp. CBMAI 1063]|nr:unnamed protein product [Peniophora sp. CBMAI 1063]